MSAIYASFTLLASAFVVSSIYQITVGVFAAPRLDASPSSIASVPSDTSVIVNPVNVANSSTVSNVSNMSDVSGSIRQSASCASGIRSLAVAVDRGILAAAAATDRTDAEHRYRTALSPEWDEAKQRDLVFPCTSDSHGLDAVAAVTRFDRAAEGAIRRQTDELGPVRRAVDSFIR